MTTLDLHKLAQELVYELMQPVDLNETKQEKALVTLERVQADAIERAAQVADDHAASLDEMHEPQCAHAVDTVSAAIRALSTQEKK